MRRPAVLGLAMAMLFVGCGGEGGEPVESGGGPTAPTAAPGGGPRPTDHVGNATSVCSPSGAQVTITANATTFDKDCYAAPASLAFTISFDNKDSLAHNIAILESHAASDVLFRAEIFQGPRSMTFNVGALRPGTYAFHCEVHPAQMSGTFIVK